MWKSLLDGLVRAGLLVGDCADFVELGTVEFRRGVESCTEVILEDLEET